MRKLVVLGSTGSIGCQTLDIVRAFPDQFEVVGLAAGNNYALLSDQIKEFHPKHICCINPPKSIPSHISFTSMEAMVSLAEVEIVMVATMGSVGLVPTLNALKHQKAVALSNKEPIVMAGHIIKAYEQQYGGTVLPVDSEPSAIWQCLQGENNEISRLIITASGGPFRETALEDLDLVTAAEALNHPTWQMGEKITIDSATMMNKAFEVVEAHWLFGVGWDRIEVVIHPQSTVHSMVEFGDGSVKAQMGPPSMRLPIQYALFYPDRRVNETIPRLATDQPYSLDFRPLDEGRYPCFELALNAAKQGGTYPTVLIAADEVAVSAFLTGKIGFTDIYRVVERVLAQHDPSPGDTVAELLSADTWATNQATTIVARSWLKDKI